jgi:hypothetical protein
VDARDWSEEMKRALKNPDDLTEPRMQVGKPGICWAQTPAEITAVLHDLQATHVPAAMLTTDKTEGAVSTPCRVWKAGKCTIRRLWLTQLGTGEGGQVHHVREMEDTELEPDAGLDQGDDRLTTEVLALRVHQAWCPKRVWEMWKSPDTRATVGEKWCARQGLLEALEDSFHPRMFGEAPHAMATLSLRVDIASREAILLASRLDFVEVKALSKSRFPEVVWLGEVPPNPENWNRLSSKADSVPGHRGILIAPRGPGVRVPPEQFT